MTIKAAIITIGTELTDGRIVDTNAGFMAAGLEKLGLRVALALTLPDEGRAISNGLAFAREQDVSLIVVSGGLGPTTDDITAAVIAGALGLEIALDPEAEQLVAAATGRDAADLSPHQYKQAELPIGARPLTPAGTAPGFIILDGDVPIVCLPGVPWELAQMWESAIAAPEVAAIVAGLDPPGRSALCFYGAGEPAVSAAVESFLGTQTDDIEISICARYREVVLEAVYPPASKERVDELLAFLRQRFVTEVYSTGKNIEEILGVALIQSSRTLAVAESCTGGMLGEALTSVSGSSGFFLGGVIAYANEVKSAMLGVSRETLETVGAVSKDVAGQMAAGARQACGADYGIGITGIAGPDGGTTEKPVGLVYIGIASANTVRVLRFDFPGGREDVRRGAVTAALHMVHSLLLEESTGR